MVSFLIKIADLFCMLKFIQLSANAVYNRFMSFLGKQVHSNVLATAYRRTTNDTHAQCFMLTLSLAICQDNFFAIHLPR